MLNKTMPSLNLDLLKLTLSESEFSLVARCVATKGKNKGLIRASKPPVSEADHESGKAAYVWRMIVFTASPIPQHHCMPVCADFDLPKIEGLPNWKDPSLTMEERYAALKVNTAAESAQRKELEALADKALKTIPRDEHHGTMRWARAFGIC